MKIKLSQRIEREFGENREAFETYGVFHLEEIDGKPTEEWFRDFFFKMMAEYNNRGFPKVKQMRGKAGEQE